MRKIYQILAIVKKVAAVAARVLPIFNGKGKLDKVIEIDGKVNDAVNEIEATEQTN